jgi:hypothetical protein
MGPIEKRFRTQGSHSGISAFSLTDHGYPAASQMAAKIATTFVPYVGRRGRLFLGRFSGGGPFSTRSAYLR